MREAGSTAVVHQVVPMVMTAVFCDGSAMHTASGTVTKRKRRAAAELFPLHRQRGNLWRMRRRASRSSIMFSLKSTIQPISRLNRARRVSRALQ